MSYTEDEKKVRDLIVEVLKENGYNVDVQWQGMTLYIAGKGYTLTLAEEF